MLEKFKVLSKHEYGALKDSVSLITILIAGADGNIEDKEVEWAEKVVNIRGYKMKHDMKEFYHDVETDFHERIKQHLETLPSNTEERSKFISEKLSHLNPILAKLDNQFGAKVYYSLISLAEHVAKASGGVLGFFTINAKEAKLVGLPMIHPINSEDEEEE